MRGFLFQPSKVLFAIAMMGLLALGPMRVFGQAEAPATPGGQPQWKDRAEYDLFADLSKDTNMKTRLEKLQQWEQKYPQSDYAKQRRLLFLQAYVSLGQAKEATEAAKQVLADDPKNFLALYAIVSFTQALAGNNPSPEVLDQGEKATNQLLANIDTPPANVTEDQWKAQKPQFLELAHSTLGWIAYTKKNWPGAESEYQKTLQVNPNNGQADYFLATAIYSQKDPAKIPTALFYFARAASYEGQGALPPQGRQAAMAFVQKAYKSFHGSDADFSKLIAAAKAGPNPPADFSIKNAIDIAKEEAKSDEDFRKQHPDWALWKDLKAALTGADGATYFNTNMKDAKLQTFKGKVVSMTPETKPKEIQLAIDDGTGNATSADATLKFDMPLPGKVDAGTELSFEGVAESFTANPFMVVFNVDKDDLHGWTGKNAPAPVRRPAAKKKASAEK